MSEILLKQLELLIDLEVQFAVGFDTDLSSDADDRGLINYVIDQLLRQLLSYSRFGSLRASEVAMS